tara:strand:+ start:458 stop:1015 length:558 start_codon:yes stop_codon:yes gene_type:complete
MKFIFIIFFFLIQNLAHASNKIEIINNLNSIENIKFEFVQKINEKIEKGKCIIYYPKKKIFCEYKDIYNKIMVSNGKVLIIKSDRNKDYYKYSLKKTPLNFILDKKFLIKKMHESNEYTELNDKYIFEINFENNSLIIFFNKQNLNLMGWITNDIYQNKVETKISNLEKNIILDKRIFSLQNYIN